MKRRVEGKSRIGQSRRPVTDETGKKGTVGRPRQLPEGHRKVDVRVSDELYEALRKYAFDRRWGVSTAARYILEDVLLPKITRR